MRVLFNKLYNYFYKQELHLTPNQEIFIWIINNVDKYKLDWNELSKNKNITMDIIKKYNNKPWSFKYVSLNPNITFNDVIENSNYDWDWDNLSCNPNINMQDVLNNIDKLWNFNNLSFNKNIKFDDIINNQHLPWAFDMVLSNPNVDFNIFVEYYNLIFSKINKKNLITYILYNKNITFNQFINILDIIKYDFNKNNHYNAMYRFTKNNITIDDLSYSNINRYLIFDALLENKNISIEYITTFLLPLAVHKNIHHNYYKIIYNPGATIDFILKLNHTSSDIMSLPCLSLDIINSGQIELFYKELSKNPNLDLLFIMNNIKKLDTFLLCSNQFN